MAGISTEQKIKDYRQVRKNYLERYRYWSKKLGPDKMPPMVEAINIKKDKISTKDISKMEHMKAGYFESYAEEFDYNAPDESELERLEKLSKKNQIISEVDMYYQAFLDIPNAFKYHPTQSIFQSFINQIDARYEKRQIAFIMRKYYEDIQSMIGYVMIYENDYWTNPKTTAMATQLNYMFEYSPIPEDISDEIWESYDRDFANAGDFGELTEEDYM